MSQTIIDIVLSNIYKEAKEAKEVKEAKEAKENYIQCKDPFYVNSPNKIIRKNISTDNFMKFQWPWIL